MYVRNDLRNSRKNGYLRISSRTFNIIYIISHFSALVKKKGRKFLFFRKIRQFTQTYHILFDVLAYTKRFEKRERNRITPIGAQAR